MNTAHSDTFLCVARGLEELHKTSWKHIKIVFAIKRYLRLAKCSVLLSWLVGFA